MFYSVPVIDGERGSWEYDPALCSACCLVSCLLSGHEAVSARLVGRHPTLTQIWPGCWLLATPGRHWGSIQAPPRCCGRLPTFSGGNRVTAGRGRGRAQPRLVS